MRHHPPALRARAIDMLRAGHEIGPIANDLGVDESTVRAWKQLAIIAGELSRPQVRKRSGVIAPAPYRRGCVWGAGQ